ncbi:MAG: hypothetical protein K6F50_07130, partial [Kiritimatiellae bacterium]|nr:hypothetical protein [Kiritimatiellia bacterium]
ERYSGMSEEEILDEMKREAECGEEGELACETEGLAATRGLTAGQAIKLSLKAFDRGAYISFSRDFGKRMRRLLPRRFPSEGDWSLARMRIFGGAGRVAA